MTPQEKQVHEIYELASNGNVEALNFLEFFHAYCHDIDDFIDNKERDPEKFVSLLIKANLLYTLPYWTRHAHRLHMIVAKITSDFADAVRWEKDSTEWKRRWADVLRFAGNDMVLAVAMIEGGFTTMRKLSPVLREIAHSQHHDEDGRAE